MPSKKARINLTVDADMNELLDDLARLTGIPKSRLVMDFIIELKPTLLDIRNGLELAKKSRDSLPEVLASIVARTNSQVGDMNKDYAEYLQSKQGES